MKPAIGCWQTAAGPLQLPHGQIDLWRFRVDLPDKKIERLKEHLTADEHQRAARLLIADKRQQFIAARAYLRLILARYLDCSPTEPVFHYGPQGKPRLLHNSVDYHFNLAHSGAWSVLAVSRSGEVGVDLEQVDPALDYQLLADQFFTTMENDCLLAVSELRRRRTFYRIWTRKESLLKQHGVGFSTTALDPECMENSSCFFFALTKNYLGALSSNFEITSINKIQPAE